VARFVASRTAIAPVLVLEHAFRGPPRWGALALPAGLLGVWLAGRTMAEPAPTRSGSPRHVPLTRALPRTSD